MSNPDHAALAAYGRIASTAPASFRMSIAGFQGSVNYHYPGALGYGANISTYAQFFPAGIRGDLAWGPAGYNSQWQNRDGYLAFRFDVGQGTQYGWMELTLVSGLPTNVFKLEGYAWADPGESLFAGQVPEAGSLGLLSLGALGLISWRLRRKVVAC